MTAVTLAAGTRVQVYGRGMRMGLRSGQVAAAAGVNLQTLRYYERRGLVTEPARTNGGHRLYPPQTVTLLRVIKTAQRLGFTLDEVAELLDAATHRHGHRPRAVSGSRARAGTRPPAEAGLRARAEVKLAEVERKIAELLVIRDTLREAVTAGCDDLVACAEASGCPLPFEGLAVVPSTEDQAGCCGPARSEP